MSKREKKGLGPWFPSATVIKGVEFDASVMEITIVLFYCYVRPTWSEVRKEEAITELSELGVKLNLGGRLRVAQEGINATVTGTHAEVVAFTDALKVFDDSFKSVDFKFIEHMPLDRAFGELKVCAVIEPSTSVKASPPHPHPRPRPRPHPHPLPTHTYRIESNM
jgi:hypothetical protein